MSSKRYFDQVAGQWDAMRSAFFSETLRDKAIAMAAVETGGVAADIGAGTGFMTEGLLQRGLAVLAVDQSAEMLEVLRSKFGTLQELDCRQGESEQLPVEEGEVDYVFANMYLHHVESPSATIREMVRILKPGGRLVITDLDTHAHAFLLTEHHDRWPGFSREQVAGWLSEAGLGNVTVTCASEECCAQSGRGCEVARVSIFMACGHK